MRLLNVVALGLLASTGLAAPAVAEVFYRGTSHAFTAATAQGEVGLAVTGAGGIAYGGEWNVLIEATNAAAYSMVLSGPLPNGVVQSPSGSGIRLTGRTFDGSYGPFSVAVTAGGSTSTLSAGPISVAAPAAPMVLTPSAAAPTYLPTQDWDLSFAASGGLAPYTFVSTVGLPGTVAAAPPAAGATSLSLTGRAPSGTYAGVSVRARDAAGKVVDSSAITVRVVGSGATVTPTTVQTSDAVFTAVPQAPAAVFQVTNAGPAPSGAVSLAMPTGTGDFALGGTCTTLPSVAAGASCTVTLTRTPTIADGTKTGSFTVAFANGGTGAGSVTGNATGYVPSVTLGAASLTATVGTPFSYDLKTLATTSNISAAGLAWTSADKPAWMGISAATGIASGTPTAAGSASFEVVATNERADGRRTYTIVVAGVVLNVVRIVSGTAHTCVVTTAGGAKCWGYDAQGQLGNDALLVDKATPVDVAGLTSGVAWIAAGGHTTCAVTTAGGAKCWGSDSQGKLGDDATIADKSSPTDVAGLTTGVSSISVGSAHACAVRTTGTLLCWGQDNVGQLGDDATLANKQTPVAVSGLSSGVSSVSPGANHTCALLTSGQVMCWGSDVQGQLGDGATLANKPTPVLVSGIAGASSLTSGGLHSCAIVSGGNPYCWGEDLFGQLGNDATNLQQPSPVLVSGLSGIAASISAGGNHTCAVTTAGALRCWGYDAKGQLGDDSALANKSTPVAVTGLSSGVSAVAGAGGHTCAVMTTGAVKCWGDSEQGQVGNGVFTTTRVTTPADVVSN